MAHLFGLMFHETHFEKCWSHAARSSHVTSKETQSPCDRSKSGRLLVVKLSPDPELFILSCCLSFWFNKPLVTHISCFSNCVQKGFLGAINCPWMSRVPTALQWKQVHEARLLSVSRHRAVCVWCWSGGLACWLLRLIKRVHFSTILLLEERQSLRYLLG